MVPAHRRGALSGEGDGRDGVPVSFRDAKIVAVCLECGVTRLYSEDLPGRAPPGPLEIVNPFPPIKPIPSGTSRRTPARIANDKPTCRD
jgi:hypothetical protein